MHLLDCVFKHFHWKTMLSESGAFCVRGEIVCRRVYVYVYALGNLNGKSFVLRMF